MKRNDKNTTHLFGYGLIGVSAGIISGMGLLVIEDLSLDIERKAGDKFTDDDIKKDGHTTHLIFSKQKDITSLIKKLNVIKSEMKKDKPIKPKEIKLLCEKRYHERPAKKSLTK